MSAILRAIPNDPFAQHRARELAELNLMLSAQQRKDERAAREHWERMVDLVKARPPAMVRLMEEDIGLT